MPFYSLTDVATMRLQAISFFLALLLAVAFVVQRLWNWCQRDQTALPRLSYKGALGLIVVGGLLVQVVLAMIAGARELMTPGAWVKAGATYQLRRDAEAYLDLARRRDIERLRGELWRYAEGHDGALPLHEFVPELPEGLWGTIDPSGARFVYVGGRRIGDRGRLVAYEPGVFGPRRFGLYADGSIREVDTRDVPHIAASK